MLKLNISKLNPKNISFKSITTKGKKGKKKFIVIGVLIVLVGGFIVFKLKSPKQAMDVQYTVLQKTNIVNSINVLGDVKSDNSTNVYTTSNNIVKEVKVKVGDKVKKGDVLAVLDTEKLEKDIAQSTVTVNASEANAKIELDNKKSAYENAVYINENNLNTEIINANAAVDSTKRDLDDKQRIYEYNKVLLGYGEISDQDLKKSETDYKNAKSDYDKALVALENENLKINENINNLKNGYETAKINYDNKSERIALENKQNELQECTIKAPVDGTITSVNAVVGSPSTGALFEVEDLDNVTVTVSIKEVDVTHIKAGQKATIKTDATEDIDIEGEIQSVDPTAKKEKTPQGETQSSNDVNFEAKVKMKEPNDKIRVGMNARVNIILDEKNDIYAVPHENIVEDENGSSIYVAEKQGEQYIVKQVPITIGMESDFNVEISGDEIKDGLMILSNPSSYTVGSNIEIKGDGAGE
ncbi:efflux RND transporter periplasmic adaptor subunit [Clostridium sp. CTA-5]